MLIAQELQEDRGQLRTQPWSQTSYSNGGGAYYSLTDQPELIHQVLEDFVPHANREAVQVFYRFLAWINGDDSLLETTDCAMRPPHEHQDTIFRAALKIDGRLEVVYREDILNVALESSEWLEQTLSLYLQIYRPDFHRALIRVSSHPTDYVRLVGQPCRGKRLRLTFNAYGDSEAETFESLVVVFNGMWEAAKRTSHAMQVTVPDFP